MSTDSALYFGSVMHNRLVPKKHRFRYRAFWVSVDLDEIEELSRTSRLFSYNRTNVFTMLDRDHGDGSDTPIRDQVVQWLAADGIDIGSGRITLLCMPRTLGYCFNPLSVFFCHRSDGSLAAIVYEVHNTFSQRHRYVAPVDGDRPVIRQRLPKRFYVSPFMEADLLYSFKVRPPAGCVAVTISAAAGDRTVFGATLQGERRAFSDTNLIRALIMFPAVTLKVIGAIHWEALRLLIKGFRIRAPEPSIEAVQPTPLD
jgi:uncharacterized protein